MDHYLPHSLSVDNRRSFFDDDDSSILDENILDNNLIDSTLDVSPIDRRREAGLDANAIFSPSNDWDFDHDMGLPAGPADDSTPVPAGAATFEHSNGTNNPFIKLEQAQPAYAQPHNWSSGNVASGSCTPTVYDNNAFQGAGFDESGSYLAPAMGAASGATSAFESNSMNKRMRPQSPGPRAHSPLHVVRRDGIRKKNARFDIPAERTLMNIDQLIARSQDENEIKELKQQKRLLRNRQAALDSRQRKKQHTERLEEEKKLHSAVIQELEDKLQQMTMQEEQMHQRYQEVAREREFLHHKAETLQMEKEEMVRSHTLESGELRKKNTYLQDQLQKMQDALERTPMAHQQSSSGFSDAFDFEADFDLDSDCWNDPMPMADVAPSIKTEKAQAYSDSDKPAAAPGLLLILLLCGAFVASSKSSSPALPPLPKQLQTASASVLQNIFQDAGVTEVNRVENIESSPGDWVVAKSDVPQMVGLQSTMAVINSFDKPSAKQQHEQFMQLTPAEYNDVTSNDFLRDPEPVNLQSRRRIQENLASMRNNKASAADVYTRSLLWDRVDAEVVRRFAAFARQAQGQTAGGNNEGGGAEAHS
ncbi:bZIP transcription factor [Geopyxis carbonaria]|nr:bZIP transcription factor [Geopyxis carbonaria]